MNFEPNSIGIVILAAGHGTRMKSDLPKVMHELNGKPLIEHMVDRVEASACCVKPVIIVNPNHTMVQECLGDRAHYVVQPEQLGTGHAVAQAKSLLQGKTKQVVVLYGDMPFVKSDSINRLIERHIERDNIMTLMTFTVPHFEDEFAPFFSFSRIVRGGEQGHIVKDVQKKDASEEELQITELNPCYFCFDSDWLWKHVEMLDNNNAQAEYYLTDLLKKAIDMGEKISSIEITPGEARGINSKEDLEVAQKISV